MRTARLVLLENSEILRVDHGAHSARSTSSRIEIRTGLRLDLPNFLVPPEKFFSISLPPCLAYIPELVLGFFPVWQIILFIANFTVVDES